jgi:hypothetical protein
MTTSPHFSFASLNGYEPSLVVYLRQVISQPLNFLKTGSWMSKPVSGYGPCGNFGTLVDGAVPNVDR